MKTFLKYLAMSVLSLHPLHFCYAETDFDGKLNRFNQDLCLANKPALQQMADRNFTGKVTLYIKALNTGKIKDATFLHGTGDLTLDSKLI